MASTRPAAPLARLRAEKSALALSPPTTPADDAPAPLDRRSTLADVSDRRRVVVVEGCKADVAARRRRNRGALRRQARGREMTTRQKAAARWCMGCGCGIVGWWEGGNVGWEL